MEPTMYADIGKPYAIMEFVFGLLDNAFKRPFESSLEH
jgi:hypothetical protein